MESAASEGLVDQAVARIEAGDLDGALSLLSEALGRNPNDGRALALTGVCRAQQGNLAATADALRSAERLLPYDVAVLYNLAHVLQQSGDADGARRRLERALDIDPNHADARRLLTYLNSNAPAPTPPAAFGQQSSSTHFSIPGESTVPSPGGGEPPQAIYAGPAGQPPGLTLRLIRGVGWGFLWGQVWTAMALFWGILFSSFGSRGGADTAFAWVVIGVIFFVVNGFFGTVAGLITAAVNADENLGAWIGVGAGMCIFALQLAFGIGSWINILFFFFTGRWIGGAIAVRVGALVRG